MPLYDGPNPQKHMSRLGPFAIEEKLSGSHAMFRAVHVQQQRSVALKVFPAPFGTGKEARLAFSLEWEQLKALRHPNIVRCFGGGMEDKRGFLAYELIRGESVASILKRRGRLAWETVVEYALQIAAALEYAHEQGVVHEALTTDKILVADDGRVLVSDFRDQRHKHPAFQSSAGRTPYSARYLAPEQWEDPPSITPKCDMYALGCILFEMVTGKPPFNGSTIEQLAEQHRSEAPDRVSRQALECPIWLDSLIHQMLEKDPQRRPHSMAAVRIALEEMQKKIVEGVGVAEHATSGLSALKTSVDRREAARVLGKKQRKRKARVDDGTPFYERVWFLALCLLVVMGASAWALWPPSEEKLFRRAEALLASGEVTDQRRAREQYLEPLLSRFPNGQFAAQAREILDEMDMDAAIRRLEIKLKLGRTLDNEGERLLAEAREFQQFGDKLAALEKYESMIDLLPDTDENRPYRNIARRNAAELQGEGNLAEQRRAFLEERLADADTLYADGKSREAERIWRSIINLYSKHSELDEYVQRARRALGESLLETSAEEPAREE